MNARTLILASLLVFLVSFAHVRVALAFDCSKCVSGSCSPACKEARCSVCDANVGGSTGTTLVNPLGNSSCSATNSCVSDFINNIMKLVIKAGTVAVILMLVYVGFLFVTAQGEPAAITKARNALLWTVVGALILLGSQAISLGIQATVKAIGG